MNHDLVVVVADKDIEQSIEGVLSRPKAVGMRKVDYLLVVHPNHDPGCYETGDQLAAAFRAECNHALVVFDRDWQGAPSSDADVLASHVEQKLTTTWRDCARCIVIDPEVEQWVWSDSPHVAEAVSWPGSTADLRAWLQGECLWPDGATKPPDPKAAFLKALRKVRKPPSSAIFARLASTVSFGRCSDSAFLRVLATLRGWFPSVSPSPP